MDYSESQEKRGTHGKCERYIGFLIGSYGRATFGYYFIFFTYYLPDRRSAPLGSFGLASPNCFRHYPFYI